MELESKQRPEQDTKSQDVNMPLTPNHIPVAEVPSQENTRPSREATSISNPLDFTPLGGLSGFLKIPGILIFAILSGYLVGRFRLSFFFLIVTGHIVYYAFSRRVKAYTRTLEAISRETHKRESLGEFETVEWMNHIISKFWEVAEQGVSSIIFNEVNNVLKKISLKPGLSLKLTEITLGTRPPIIERISFLENAEDKIVLEFAVNFIPVQASEDVLSYFKRERAHWNTYIELGVVLGNIVEIPILVKNFTFSGIFKVELDLSRKIPFASRASVSLLEMPVIDFQLIPLKSVDMLDLPYIGGLLNTLIEKGVESVLLEPKAFSIDLVQMAKYRGTIVGVVYVYVHGLETVNESTYWVHLDNNGKMFGETLRKLGRDPIFDEGFYDVVTDTTRYLGVTLRSTGEANRIGRICLRNLNKGVFSEKVRLSDENSSRYLGITAQFYPITDMPTDSMVIGLSLISIEDLLCTGDPINKLYSTYCLVSLETREALVKRRVLKCRESKRIFATKNPFYNQHFTFFIREFEDYVIKIRVMNEKDGAELGKVIVPLGDMKNKDVFKYRISGVESGDINLGFDISYIDMVDDEFTPEELFATEQPAFSVDDGASSQGQHGKEMLGSYVEDDHRTGEVDAREIQSENLFLGVYNKAPLEQRFVNYRKAYRFSIKDIKAFGTFFIVFETDHLNIKMEPFSTEIKIQRDVVVPIVDEICIRVRLFQHSLSGDILISEEMLALCDRVVVFDKIRVEFDVEEADFSDCNEAENSENTKVLQVRINSFSRPSAYTLDYFTEELDHNLKLVHHKTTHIIGKEDVLCRLKDGSREISRVVIPKRNCADKICFGDVVTAELYCKCQVCPFVRHSARSRGELEVFIIKASNLKAMSNGSCDPCIKVYLNNEKIYKTEKKTRCQSPIYNESFKIGIQKDVDLLSFHVYSHNSISTDSLISYRELPLFNLPEGYSRYDVGLNDGESGEPCDSTLQLIFNYKRESSATIFGGVL